MFIQFFIQTRYLAKKILPQSGEGPSDELSSYLLCPGYPAYIPNVMQEYAKGLPQTHQHHVRRIGSIREGQDRDQREG